MPFFFSFIWFNQVEELLAGHLSLSLSLSSDLLRFEQLLDAQKRQLGQSPS
jgi:hypothetical protein